MPEAVILIKVVLWILSTRLGTLILCGSSSLCPKIPFIRKFTELTVKERQEVLKKWSAERLFSLLRVVFLTLKAFTLRTFLHLVVQFANCLIEARNELQHKSEVIQRRFIITKALLFKAERSSFDRLWQQDFVVKNINMVELSVPEEGQFQYVAFTMLGLRHPNIVSLIDYCKEHGQCLLFYEYVGQHTLKDYLHYPEDPAPEHGKRGIDKTKSDVYEFGVLLMELLTGKQPFDSNPWAWQGDNYFLQMDPRFDISTSLWDDVSQSDPSLG